MIFLNFSLLTLKIGLEISDIIQVQLFLRDLSQFKMINEEYAKFFGTGQEPPTRLCVETELPTDIPFILNLTAMKRDYPIKRKLLPNLKK